MESLSHSQFGAAIVVPLWPNEPSAEGHATLRRPYDGGAQGSFFVGDFVPLFYPKLIHTLLGTEIQS